MIIIQAVRDESQLRRERIVAENLDVDFYLTQSIERLGWATSDAEALETARVTGDADTRDGRTGREDTRVRSVQRRHSLGRASGGRGRTSV
jgi:hypothetical protein